MQAHTLGIFFCGVLLAAGCDGLDVLSKTGCAKDTDCLSSRFCQVGTCVARFGPSMEPLFTGVSGMVQGESPTLRDAAFIPGDKCGVYIAISGNSLAWCHISDFKQSILKPYLQLSLTASDIGSYSLIAEGSCSGAPAGQGFFATFVGNTTSADDALSGSVTVGSSSPTQLSGSYDITFTHDGTTSAGRLQGSFIAHPCLGTTGGFY